MGKKSNTAGIWFSSGSTKYRVQFSSSSVLIVFVLSSVWFRVGSEV